MLNGERSILILAQRSPEHTIAPSLHTGETAASRRTTTRNLQSHHDGYGVRKLSQSLFNDDDDAGCLHWIQCASDSGLVENKEMMLVRSCETPSEKWGTIVHATSSCAARFLSKWVALHHHNYSPAAARTLLKRAETSSLFFSASFSQSSRTHSGQCVMPG